MYIHTDRIRNTTHSLSGWKPPTTHFGYPPPRLNPLMDVARYIRHETFISDVRLPTMSLGLRLCASREAGTGGGGWVSAIGRGNMDVSWLGLEKPWVRAGLAISLLLCTNGLRKQSSCLVKPPFLAANLFSQS